MPEEIARLLECCLPERRLLYETALSTGLRANELIHVTPVLLDIFRCGIRLEAAWTKNRLDGFQPVPRWLMDRLLVAAQGLGPTQPIFRIQKAHAARMVRDDMERAGLPVFKPGEGTIDFHALRTTYVTMLDMNGASAKEAQDLARHSTAVITLNSYIRSTDDRKRRVVEAAGDLVKGPEPTQQGPNGQMTQNE
jgi:integrase